MIAVPVFAASFNYEEAALVLNELGLFKGKSETEYKPALEDRLLREEAVALLLRMFDLEDEALAMDDKEANDLLAKFADADEIATWARKYVAYAVKNEVIVGRPDGKFAPQDNLIGREYAKMVLAMLGYVQGTDFEYKFSSVKFANVTDFSQTEAAAFDEAILVRDDVVGMSFFALMAEYVTGDNAGKTVIEVIVGDDEDLKAIAIEAGLLEEAVVVSVAALDDIVIKVGEALNLPATVKATFSDGKEADVAVTWPAVDASEAMEKTEFEGTIEGTDVVAKINVTIEVDALLVNSVTADNLVEVVVEYNQDVSDNAAVAKKDNYTLNVGKISSISVDGNTAVLSLARKDDSGKDIYPKNQTPAKLTVKDAILEAAETFEFTYFDRTLPEVLGLEATGPKEFTITFSEPIKAKGIITVKSGTSTLSVDTNKIVLGTSKVTVPLYSTLVDGKDYEVTIKEFKDYADYNNVVKTITYAYVKDTTAPVAEIESAAQECVAVKFNKPVSGLVKEQFSHTFTAYIPTKITSDADGKTLIDSAKSYSKVYVWFYTDSTLKENPIQEGDNISFRILAKVTVSSKDYEIKDLWGNKFEDATFTLSVVADKTAPEIKEIKVTAEDAISVEFTKKVDFKNANIEILNSEGKEISGVKPDFAEGQGTKFTVGLGKKLPGSTIIVNIKNVYDATLNSNKLDFYSTTLDITDLTKPEVEKALYDSAKDILYVFFNEDMDEESALNASNYFLYNATAETKYTKLSKAGTFFEGSKIVMLNVKDQPITTGSTKLFITGVKDVAGNEIIPVFTEFTVDSISTNKPYIESVVATDIDTIEVLFNEQLALVDKAAFEIKVGSEVFEIASMEEVLDKGKTKLIIKVFIDEDEDHILPYDAEDLEISIVKADVDVILIENLFDEMPDLTNTKNINRAIADKIAPVLATAKQNVGNDNPAFDDETQLKLTFKEGIWMSDTSLAATDFVITVGTTQLLAGIDYEIVDYSEGSSVITIQLNGKYAAYRGKLTIKTADTVKYITDGAGNKMAAFSKDVTMVDRSYGVNAIDETNLVGTFDKGILEIKMAQNGVAIPFTLSANEPGDFGDTNKGAYWVGVKIKAPTAVNIGDNYTFNINIDGEDLKDDQGKIANITLDGSDYFNFWFKAGGLTEKVTDATKNKASGETTLKVKWSDNYTETIKIKHTDLILDVETASQE